MSGKVLLSQKRRRLNTVKLGQIVPHRNLKKDTKQEALNFLLAKYVPLSERKPAPMVVFSGKQCLHFSHLFLTCNYAYGNAHLPYAL